MMAGMIWVEATPDTQITQYWKGTRKVESGRKSQILIWACVGAAAAGIVAVGVLSRWRNQGISPNTITQIRDVQDVLTDCYRKLQEIEEHIPELVPARRHGDDFAGSLTVRSASNGSPAI